MDESMLRQAEHVGLNASAPQQQLLRDGWLIRLSPGKAKRARCINALAAGQRPLADKLVECAALYREAGLPMIVRVTPFSEPASLDRDLEGLGWARFDDTRVMWLRSLAPISAMPEAPRPAGIVAEAAGPIAFAAAIGRLRGSSPEQIEAHAKRLAASPVEYHGRIWRGGDKVVACGQYAREGRWVGLYDIAVAPAHRQRGLGRAMCTSLLREALAQGADVAYLQVDAGNAPARALYQRLGFSDGYAYHYRSLDPAAAA
jgi:GNAT superfamily N-acetyltransferase